MLLFGWLVGWLLLLLLLLLLFWEGGDLNDGFFCVKFLSGVERN